MGDTIVWQRLADPYRLIEKEAAWIGVDVGLKRDSTAVVIVQYRPDGRLHATGKLWIPTNGIKRNAAKPFIKVTATGSHADVDVIVSAAVLFV